jgi:hypothetical protein
VNQQTNTSATLRVVTMPPAPDADPCDDTYTCRCSRCEMERAQRVVRGIRRTQRLPVKRAA